LTYSSILWVKIGTNIPDFAPQNRPLGGLWGPELKNIHDISIGSFGPTPRRPDMSYRQLLLHLAFEGKNVTRLMNPEPDTVSPDMSLSSLIEEHLPRQQGKTFPVTDNGRLAGCVTLAQIKMIPREEWGERRVGDILSSCPEGAVIHPDADVLKVLDHMKQAGLKRVLVVEEGKLLGTLAYSEISEAFSAWMELESES
jgi:predicted transcriptional regulator